MKPWWWVASACLSVTVGVRAECPTGRFVNPVTDVAWECVFPMSIGGVSTGAGPEEDPDAVADPVCACGPTTVGITASFWEPARMIETVVDPYCFAAMGLPMTNPTPGMLTGSLDRSGQSGKAFAQVHYYIFPAWSVLDLFTDVPCIEEAGFDVAWISEILPTWNNDLLAFLLQPEALLFANPAAALACMADSAAAASGLPSDLLFWCMGSWGNAYPLAGSITATDYVEAHAGIAARSVYYSGRTGLLADPGVHACGSVVTPIWRKRNYRLQEMQPVRSTCQPIGRTGLLWTGGKNPLYGGDNFVWALFRRVKCCLTY